MDLKYLMCDEPRNQKKIDETVIRMDEKRKTADKWQSKELCLSLLSYFVVNEEPGSKRENQRSAH